MSASLAITVTLYAAILFGWAALDALRGRSRRPAQSAGLIVLEAGLLVQALIGTVAMLGGQRPAEPVTHPGYLVASVLVLPIVLPTATGLDGGWQTAITALACLAVLVVELRLGATWGPGP